MSRRFDCVGRIEGQETLAGFEDIQGTIVNAREGDGSVVATSRQLDEFVQQAFKRDEFPITHGVFGGKTGLRDEVMPGSLEGGLKSLGVVDACQGRFSKQELKEWLEQDSLVLFTGSKFFQAPPFCGAVVIPPRIAQNLRNVKITADSNKMFSREGLGGKNYVARLMCSVIFLPFSHISYVFFFLFLLRDQPS